MGIHKVKTEKQGKAIGKDDAEQIQQHQNDCPLSAGKAGQYR